MSDKAIESPEWQELYERPKHYDRYTVPKPAKILLAACDVQFDSLEVSVVAFYKHQSFVITHEVIIGNTTSIDDECWAELDELLAKDWTHASGSKIRIHRLAIDAHYNTNVVANYARKRKRVIPVTGVDNNWKADLLPSRPLDIKKNGKYYRTGKRRWPIGVSLVKMDLYNRLKLKVGEDGCVPSECVHFCDGLPEEYYKQLTGEVC